MSILKVKIVPVGETSRNVHYGISGKNLEEQSVSIESLLKGIDANDVISVQSLRSRNDVDSNGDSNTYTAFFCIFYKSD